MVQTHSGAENPWQKASGQMMKEFGVIFHKNFMYVSYCNIKICLRKKGESPMKQKSMLCAAGLAVFLVSGCGGKEKQLEYIGAPKAKSLALEACGVAASQAEFTSVDMSRQNGQDYYEVEFTALGEEYSYDIDALTGVIIDADLPVADTLDGKAASDQMVSGEKSTSAADTGQTGKQQAPAGMITEQEAKTRALAHAGLSQDEVTFLSCRLEYEDGRNVYETEFYTSDGSEYDYEIDASTGEVVKYDYDAEAAMPPAAGGNGSITEQEAIELALSQVPGASENDLVEFETDYDDGRTEYEGKIRYDGMEYEFEIDAYSGAFRSWEAEKAD